MTGKGVGGRLTLMLLFSYIILCGFIFLFLLFKKIKCKNLRFWINTGKNNLPVAKNLWDEM